MVDFVGYAMVRLHGAVCAVPHIQKNIEKCVVASPTAAIFSPGGSTPTHPVEHHLVLPPGLQAAHTAQGVQNSTVLASHQGSRPTVPP